MKLNSVLGKNWISKKYNEEIVSALKNNFNLSEILSRLIAIRRINLDEVNLYLNPKLKNTLPDPFILKDMDKSGVPEVHQFVHGLAEGPLTQIQDDLSKGQE